LAIYEVTLPIAGYAITEVEADSEKEAIENAMQSGVDMGEIEEWDTYRHIVQGNVCYAPHASASATKVAESEDD